MAGTLAEMVVVETIGSVSRVEMTFDQVEAILPGTTIQTSMVMDGIDSMMVVGRGGVQGHPVTVVTRKTTTDEEARVLMDGQAMKPSLIFRDGMVQVSPTFKSSCSQMSAATLCNGSIKP